MFHINNVSYRYPGQHRGLSNLTATVPDGITILAGPNAGGKTTLLRLLAGLLDPASGRICPDSNGEEWGAAALRRISRMVMQDADPQILGAYVGEDVMLGEAASNLADFSASVGEVLDRLALSGVWNEPVDTLSYGQKRKLCLAHALLAGPRVVLMDEPFAGLDFPSSCELRRIIRDNRRAGLTQVISTHELEPVFDLADWLVVVADGAAVAEGPPESLKSRLASWSVRPPGGGWE